MERSTPSPIAMLAATLQRARARLDDLSGSDEALTADLDYAHWLATGLRDGSTSALRSPTAGEAESRLPALLARLLEARRVLHVGPLAGRSARALAEALPPEGELVSWDRFAPGEIFDFVLVEPGGSGGLDPVTTLLDRGALSPGGLVCVAGAAAADPRVERVLLPVGEGLTLLRSLALDSSFDFTPGVVDRAHV